MGQYDHFSAALTAALNHRSDGLDTGAVLAIQAAGLNVIFQELAQRAAATLDDPSSPGEMYLRFALKAQAQCRATLAALGAAQHPRRGTAIRRTVTDLDPNPANPAPLAGEAEAESDSARNSGAKRREVLPDLPDNPLPSAVAVEPAIPENPAIELLDSAPGAREAEETEVRAEAEVPETPEEPEIPANEQLDRDFDEWPDEETVAGSGFARHPGERRRGQSTDRDPQNGWRPGARKLRHRRKRGHRIRKFH